MKRSKKNLAKLFKRMIFYYELVGFEDGKPLTKELEGIVDIPKFEYEAFSIGVKIIARPDSNDRSEKKTLKQYTIPEGFVVFLEIAYGSTQKPTAMF